MPVSMLRLSVFPNHKCIHDRKMYVHSTYVVLCITIVPSSNTYLLRMKSAQHSGDKRRVLHHRHSRRAYRYCAGPCSAISCQNWKKKNIESDLNACHRFDFKVMTGA